jgi:hypothetical protein
MDMLAYTLKAAELVELLVDNLFHIMVDQEAEAAAAVPKDSLIMGLVDMLEMMVESEFLNLNLFMDLVGITMDIVKVVVAVQVQLEILYL